MHTMHRIVQVWSWLHTVLRGEVSTQGHTSRDERHEVFGAEFRPRKAVYIRGHAYGEIRADGGPEMISVFCSRDEH